MANNKPIVVVKQEQKLPNVIDLVQVAEDLNKLSEDLQYTIDDMPGDCLMDLEDDTLRVVTAAKKLKKVVCESRSIRVEFIKQHIRPLHGVYEYSQTVDKLENLTRIEGMAQADGVSNKVPIRWHGFEFKLYEQKESYILRIFVDNDQRDVVMQDKAGIARAFNYTGIFAERADIEDVADSRGCTTFDYLKTQTNTPIHEIVAFQFV